MSQFVQSAQPVDGELLEPATLTPQEAAYLNFAREECAKLERLLLQVVVPGLGGYDNPLTSDIARHLEHVVSFSGNFCWRHRHLGASHGVVGKGGWV